MLFIDFPKNPKNLENSLYFGQKMVILSFFLFLFRNTNFYGKCNNVFKNGPIDLIYFKNVPYGVCNNALYGFGKFLCFGQDLRSFSDLGGIFNQKLAKIYPPGPKMTPYLNQNTKTFLINATHCCIHPKEHL